MSTLAIVVSSIGVCMAVALVAALLVRGLFLGYPPASLSPAATLTRKEQALIAAAANAFFPPGGPIPISGTEAGLVRYMDAYTARLPAGPRALVRLLFVFVEHGPWLFGPTRSRFTRLSQDRRIATLAAMSVSSIYFRRIAFLSLRTMLSMGYLAHTGVAERIGMTACVAPFEAVAKSRGAMTTKAAASDRPAISLHLSSAAEARPEPEPV